MLSVAGFGYRRRYGYRTDFYTLHILLAAGISDAPGADRREALEAQAASTRAASEVAVASAGAALAPEKAVAAARRLQPGRAQLRRRRRQALISLRGSAENQEFINPSVPRADGFLYYYSPYAVFLHRPFILYTI